MDYAPPHWASDLVVLGVFAAATLFAVFYTMKAPWWLSWMGRNLFFFDVAVALAMLPGFVRIVFNVQIDSEFDQWFIVTDLGVVALLILHRLYLLFKVQKGWNWRRAERRIDDVPLPDIPAGTGLAGKDSL